LEDTRRAGVKNKVKKEKKEEKKKCYRAPALHTKGGGRKGVKSVVEGSEKI